MIASVSTTPSYSDRFRLSIMGVLEAETKKIVDEEAKKAGERVEERVRGMLGQIATRIATQVSFEGFGRELRITVQLPSADKGSL